MKTILTTSLVLISVLSVDPVRADAIPARTSGEIRLKEVKADVNVNGDSVAPGTSRILVSMRLGSPDYVLPDGSWLYHGFGTTEDRATGTLVVRFVANKVSSLSLADSATVTVLRQMPRRPATGSLLAVR